MHPTDSTLPPTLSSATSDDDQAISAYLSVTNTSDFNIARAAIRQANGSLEAALQAHFDSPVRPSPGHIAIQDPPGRLYEPLSVDDSSQSHSAPTHPSPRPQRSYDAARPPRPPSKLFGFIFRLWIGPFRLLAVPVSFVADLGLTVFGLLGRLLGLRLPSVSFHWPRPSYFHPAPRTDPRTAAERWVRELEEELHARSSYTTVQPGDPAMPRLPEFLLLGYDEAVKRAKEELKVLMVVLISEEHDDTAQFKRGTLMDEELLNLITANDILVWGGDVKDRDACFAAQILDATTFPFVAFVSLQAKRPASTVSSNNAALNRPGANLMTVCTRLEGSAAQATSSRALIGAINSVVLPRTTGYLNRLRTEKSRREADRRLREEQDRAYAEAARLDRERVMRKKAELEAASRRAEELRLKQLEGERRRQARADEGEQKRRWRYWARRERMPREPAAGGVTVGFRLGNGRRVVRKFCAEDPVEALYVFVEVESGSGAEEAGELPRPRADYVHAFSFKLSTAMPRRMLPSPQEAAGVTISEFGGLDGANVNVEGNFVDNCSSSDDDGDDDDDDD